MHVCVPGKGTRAWSRRFLMISRWSLTSSWCRSAEAVWHWEYYEVLWFVYGTSHWNRTFKQNCALLSGLEKLSWEEVPLLCIETIGADCLNAAVKAGEVVSLPTISRYVEQHIPLSVLEVSSLFPNSFQPCKNTGFTNCRIRTVCKNENPSDPVGTHHWQTKRWSVDSVLR